MHASLTALWLHPSCCAPMRRLAERFRQAGSAQQATEVKLSAAEQASGGRRTHLAQASARPYVSIQALHLLCHKLAY